MHVSTILGVIQKEGEEWVDASSTVRTTAADAEAHLIPPVPCSQDTIREGEGIAGCCSVFASVLRIQRSLTETWSDLSDDGTAPSSLTRTPGQSANEADCSTLPDARPRRALLRKNHQTLAAGEDDETQDKRAAYQRFFASVVDSTDKLDRLLASLDTPARSNFPASYARRASSAEETYESETVADTVQFNTKEEANGRQALSKTLREFGKTLGSDAVVIDLRAVAFWCLAKRQKLWSEDEKLTREEQISLRNVRAMQVNHEEVDTVLGDRRKLIEDKMIHMQREVESKGKGWAKVLLDVKDGVIRSRAQAQKRTRDIISATEGRIAALKAELLESEHHVVGLSNESEEFARAKGMYTRKAELLEHIVHQQRARLEQISLDLTRAQKEATSLDGSLQNINKLSSVAEGGGSDAIALREQNEGREKLQALVREEARRNNEEQMRAITKRASMMEENKRLRDELEKAESVFDLSQTPEEIRKAQLRLHQTEIDNLRAGVKSESAKLAQTERQLAQLASRKVGQSTQSALPKPDQPPAITTKSAGHEEQTGATLEREGNPVDPQAWYQLEMLRAQHGVLVEDLEKSGTPSDVKDDPLRDTSRLKAAFWQLRGEGSQGTEVEQDGGAALELAAVAIAAEVTTTSSRLPEKILDTLDWEGQARPLEEKLVSEASRVSCMYLTRLAVELGQCDRDEWEAFRQMLSDEDTAVFDAGAVHKARQGVHVWLHSFDGEPPSFRGVFSSQTESRAELTSVIESGHARLAKLNVLLRVLWGEAPGKVSSAERTSILNDVIGVLVGESRLYPKLALRLFSTLGHDAIRRARSSSEGLPQRLPDDVMNLNLSSKGVMDEKHHRAATAVAALAALLGISESLNNVNPSAELAKRGAKLQEKIRAQIRTYSQYLNSQQTMEVLRDAQDFIEELPPAESEHGPGKSQLDIMTHLLGVLATGTNEHQDEFFKGDSVARIFSFETPSGFAPPSDEDTPMQGRTSAAMLVGVATSDKGSKTSAPRGAASSPSGRQLDGRGTLPEILIGIAGAMPCEPDGRVAHVWRTLEERIARPRGCEEIELEAFELAVDAQVLEAVKVCLLEEIEDNGLDPAPRLSARAGKLVPENTLLKMSEGGRKRGGNAPFSGSEVAADEKSKRKALQRQAETLQFKNKLNVAARTGLAIQSPVQAGSSSISAVVTTATLAKRWKTAALGDGSGLDRQELERLNSLVDMRIKNLSAQLAKLTHLAKLAQIGHDDKGTGRVVNADQDATLSPENWAIREKQLLNGRIRVHREKLQSMEATLKNTRKGDKGGMGEMESLWMSPDARLEMEANLTSISRKIGKANFLLRNMRSRWDLFRERHKHLVPLVHERLSQGHVVKRSETGADGALVEAAPASTTFQSQEPQPPYK